MPFALSCPLCYVSRSDPGIPTSLQKATGVVASLQVSWSWSTSIDHHIGNTLPIKLVAFNPMNMRELLQPLVGA